MKRRDFIAASGLAGLAPLTAFQSSAEASSRDSHDRQFLELRKYQMHIGSGQGKLHDFMRQVALPAFNKIGLEPVGAFTVMYGQNTPTLYLLLPHNSMEGFLHTRAQLLEQQAYKKAISTSMSDTNYIRYESQLMHAFEGMPQVESPKDAANDEPRIFELRTYESHNAQKAKRKIEMFNNGEIEIFRETNLTPIFFGRTLIGDRLPNLTYMVTHKNMEERNKNWEAFIEHPKWKEMASNSYYADTVSNITDIVLKPTDYSQI